MNNSAFWKRKSLTEMTTAEWESLCDNCGKCCLNKLEDEDTSEVVFTSVVCNLMDLKTCKCTRYSERRTLVSDCLDLKSEQFIQYHWLPSTCAYRLVAQGNDLPSWHPLITGDPESVHKAGVSIRSYAIKESDASDLFEHVIEWLT